MGERYQFIYCTRNNNHKRKLINDEVTWSDLFDDIRAKVWLLQVTFLQHTSWDSMSTGVEIPTYGADIWVIDLELLKFGSKVVSRWSFTGAGS